MIESRQVSVGQGAVHLAAHHPDGPPLGATVVLAHGAGTTMDHPQVVAFAAGLAARGAAAVRFNFPYTEAGRRAPDRAAVLEACYRAVLAAVRADARLGAARLIAGGRSMGGRMASHLAAAGEPLDGLLCLGYPLHPAGRPQQLRAAHLPRIAVPMLFLTGTRDALCPLDRLRPVLAALPLATLHVVEDGDHGFAVRARSGRDAAGVRAELVDATIGWLQARVLRCAAD